MADLCKHLLRQPHAQQQRPFLIAGRTAAALPERKRHEKLFTAIRAAHPRKAFFQVPAFEKLVHGGTNDRSPIALFRLEAFGVNPLELFKIVTHQSEKG